MLLAWRVEHNIYNFFFSNIVGSWRRLEYQTDTINQKYSSPRAHIQKSKAHASISCSRFNEWIYDTGILMQMTLDFTKFHQVPYQSLYSYMIDQANRWTAIPFHAWKRNTYQKSKSHLFLTWKRKTDLLMSWGTCNISLNLIFKGTDFTPPRSSPT